MPRPSKYSEETVKIAQKYIEDCWREKTTPFIEELALELDINDDTINEWEKEHEEFSATIRKLKMLQRLHLKRGALEKKYQSNVAIFLLNANHSVEEPEPTEIRIQFVGTEENTEKE